MRTHIACALIAGAAVSLAEPAYAKDCTPTNGPWGFYGNLWCTTPDSYVRNLGAGWPMNDPASRRRPYKHSKPRTQTGN